MLSTSDEDHFKFRSRFFKIERLRGKNFSRYGRGRLHSFNFPAMSETLSCSFVVKRGGILVFLIFALEFLLANALIFSYRCQNVEATNIDYAKLIDRKQSL